MLRNTGPTKEAAASPVHEIITETFTLPPQLLSLSLKNKLVQQRTTFLCLVTHKVQLYPSLQVSGRLFLIEQRTSSVNFRAFPSKTRVTHTHSMSHHSRL